MKKYMHYIKMAVLAGVVIYQVIFQRSMITETLQTTRKMDLQLDSLWSILHQYDDTRSAYETAYVELMLAQEELMAIQQDYTRIADEQQADVITIRQQLQQLVQPARDIPLYEIESVDSLLFQP
ncbi:MAG: hypothetical protein RIC06_00785 [Cyclobacteriaceae bacterium]